MIRRLSSFLPRIGPACIGREYPLPCPVAALTRHVREEVVNGKAQWIGQLPATQNPAL